MKNLHLWTVCALAAFGITSDAAGYVKHYCEYTQISNKTPHKTYFAGRAIFAPATSLVSSDETTELDAGYGIGMAYGVKLNNFRIEGEMKYVDGATYSESETYLNGTTEYEVSNTQLGLMLNGYYDIGLVNNLALYVGGGIGFVYNATNVIASNDYYNYYEEEDFFDYLFSYQIGGGVSYSLNQNLTFDLGYRYGGTSKTDYKANVKTHEITFGVRYNF